MTMTGEQIVHAEPEHTFSRTYKATEVPAAGITDTVDATPGQRASIAELLGLVDLSSFHVDFRLISCGLRRFRLSGRLTAELVQNCVVTLEPVSNRVEDTFEVEFWPSGDVEQLEAGEGPDDADVPLDGPEPLPQSGLIDVGQVAYEVLASAIDPYPRKPGAEFSWQDAAKKDDGQEGNKPFANLDVMLRRNDSGLS